MKMDMNQKSTSPKATAPGYKQPGSFGSVGTPGRVSLPQYGGEGVDKLKANGKDMNLPQYGGEGGGKEGKIPGKSDMSLILDKVTTAYNGPGRDLTKSK